jgi:hypothetical protein
MAWAPAIMFCREVLGADRVLYAMDYPYQYAPAEVTAAIGRAGRPVVTASGVPAA